MVRGNVTKIATRRVVEESDVVKEIETEKIVLSVKVATENGRVIELSEKLSEGEEEIEQTDEEELGSEEERG